MTTVALSLAFYGRGDAQRHGLPQHPHATCWPRDVVTLGGLHARKGVGHRACSRGLTRDERALCPRVPERTRLFRLFMTHQAWTDTFVASPTVRGVIDPSGIEVIHPSRDGRSPRQIGRKGVSNHRWMVGGHCCLLLNQWGLVVAWECATAKVADQTCPPRMRQCDEPLLVLRDPAVHAAAGDPTHLKRGRRGAGSDRRLLETVWSRLTVVRHVNKGMHRVWEYVHARLACTMAPLNRLVPGHG